MTENQKYPFRLSSGDYHVDLEFSEEDLRHWAPDKQKHDLHYAAWIVMNRLKKDADDNAHCAKPTQ